MPLDRLVRISRTGRQVPALPADQARKRELIEADQRVGGAARRQTSALTAPARLASRLARGDLRQRIGDRVERQQGGGVASLVVAHRLEHGEFGPFAVRRRTVRLQHPDHAVAQSVELLGGRANDMASHQRRRRLTERAGLHVMSKIDHPPILDAKVDHHRRTAQPRMRLGAGVRVCEPPEPRNVARELKDALIIDLVDHPGHFNVPI